VTKNRWSRAENAPTTEGQTCGIARYTTLVVRVTMFDFLTVILLPTCPLSPSCHASRRTCRTKVIFMQTGSSLFLANRFQIDLSCLLKLNGNSYITDRFP